MDKQPRRNGQSLLEGDMINNNKTKLRWALLLFLVLGGLGFYQFQERIYLEEWFTPQLRVMEMFGWVGLLCLGVLSVLSWTEQDKVIFSWLNQFLSWIKRWRWISLLGVFLLPFVYLFMVMGPYGIHLERPFPRIFVYLVFVLIEAALLNAWFPKRSWMKMLPPALLLLAGIYNVASYLPNISSYPLALGWSETSRYYYASTFFSERIYGLDTPWPHNHFSRYLLQAFPFLFPKLPLLAHRLWQVLLGIIFPYLTGFLLARRLGLKGLHKTLLFPLWVGLFIFQGPVLYQMLIMVLFIVWLFDSRKLYKSLLLILVASIWAGLTRINWVPMPALMASVLYILERRIEKNDIKTITRYLTPPVIWLFISGITGWIVQNWYVLKSGLSSEVIFGFLDSTLLWYRLWPNLSYKPGVVFGILLISGPALVSVIMAAKGWKKEWHPIRLLGLWMILLVVFVGGLVVSVKIGGGTNLHNMDAYLIILLLILVYLYYGKFVNEDGKEKSLQHGRLHVSLIVILPGLFACLYGGVFPERDFQQAEWVINRLQYYVDEVNEDEGEILFITQRHLITFSLIDGVENVHDYEKMIMMEMAMAGNQVYLDNFAHDLENHRFSLIIHGRIPPRHKKIGVHSLAEESNVYLDSVGKIILCYYSLEEEIIEVGIDIFVQADDKCD